MLNEEQNFLNLKLLRETQSRNFLFCFPGSGGETAIFRDLAASMEGDTRIYGVDMRAFFDLDQEFTVEQLAGPCLSIIKGMQQSGPYHVCGYSFGALVAYEVASRLSREGETVRVVAMIDTGNPAFRTQLSSAEANQLQKTYLGDRFATYFRLLAGGDIRSFAGSVSAVFASRLGVRSRRRIRRVFAALKRPMPEIFRNNDRAMFEAWRRYKPPSSPLSLLLFYGASRRAEYAGDPTLGWSSCASGKVVAELASVGHVEMMIDPHVRAFAARLSAYFPTEE